MSEPGLQRERLDDGVEVLRLDRPHARNALDTATTVALADALDAASGAPEVRVVVLSSTSERAFCAGADVREPLDHAGGVARMEAFARLYAALEACAAPTVCAAAGDVVGAGAELFAGCDLRVAGEPLKLAWAGARLGVPVGPARLVPLVGLHVASDLLLTGRRVDADEAQRLGLLHRRAATGACEAEAVVLAREVAANAGVRTVKGLLRVLDGRSERVARENEALVRFQREGAGLPSGSSSTPRPPAS